jgi:hypothetical protein
MEGQNPNSKMSLNDIKKQATQITSSIDKSIKLGHEEPGTLVGNNWMNSLTTDKEPPEITSEEVNFVEEDAPVLVEDVPINKEPENVDEYEGPGLVLNNEDLAIPEQPKMQPVGSPIDFDKNIANYMDELDERIDEAKEVYDEKMGDTNKDKDETEETDSDGNEMTADEFNRKYEEAVITIDKTGMGITINLTAAEHEKLERSKKIKIEEIESMPLKTLKTKKQKKNVKIENIIEKKQSLHSTNIVLLASNYTAVMRGCTPYELMEIIMENQNEVVNQEMRWKLIHRKLEQTSIGPMTFNEFLQNTATLDYNTFLFGILCSTYPENDKFPLNCQNEPCKRQFDHDYSIKSLIRAEKITDPCKEKVMQIVDASHIDTTAKELHTNSNLMQLKRIQLPVSEYIVDLSIQSAYDFIYKSIQEIKENKEEKYNQAAVTSSIIRKLYIPDDNDEYFEFDNPMEITKAIYNLNTTDLKVLYFQAEKILENTSFEYGLMNVVCPYCKTVTNTVPIDVETVLFYKYQQEVNTKIV